MFFSFLGVESTDQCLLNSKVLSCFSGVVMSIRSFFLLYVPPYPEGGRPSNLTESKTVPMNSMIWVGPAIFLGAMGTPKL